MGLNEKEYEKMESHGDIQPVFSLNALNNGKPSLSDLSSWGCAHCCSLDDVVDFGDGDHFCALCGEFNFLSPQEGVKFRFKRGVLHGIFEMGR